MTRSPNARRWEARRTTLAASNSLALAATQHREVARPRICPVCGGGAHWLGDLRRNRRTVWGGVLAFVDRAVAIGTAFDVLLVLPRVLEHYIRETHPGAAAPA